MRRIDKDLLAERHLGNMDDLVKEMHSERPSVQDFLAKSFGYCVLYNDTLVGWCMSEYNTGSRCEIGIETVAGYRRRGIATLTASA